MQQLQTKTGTVLVEHDEEHGVGYVHLVGEDGTPAKVERTERFNAHANLDFDAEGRLVGIELL